MNGEKRQNDGASRRIRGYRDLLAWQHGMALSLACYKLSASFPSRELYELGSQLRRAASSVPLNIAEGYGYGTRRVFLKHLRTARGSLAEVGTALDLVVALELTPERTDIREQVDRTARILHGLIRSIEESDKPDPGTS